MFRWSYIYLGIILLIALFSLQAIARAIPLPEEWLRNGGCNNSEEWCFPYHAYKAFVLQSNVISAHQQTRNYHRASLRFFGRRNLGQHATQSKSLGSTMLHRPCYISVFEGFKGGAVNLFGLIQSDTAFCVFDGFLNYMGPVCETNNVWTHQVMASLPSCDATARCQHVPPCFISWRSLVGC